MACECIPKLEKLISGRTESVILNRDDETTRDHILAVLNHLLSNLFPQSLTEGEFINKDCSDYLVYDLHLSGVNDNTSFSSIRLLDFGDTFKLVKV